MSNYNRCSDNKSGNKRACDTTRSPKTVVSELMAWRGVSCSVENCGNCSSLCCTPHRCCLHRQWNSAHQCLGHRCSGRRWNCRSRRPHLPTNCRHRCPSPRDPSRLFPCSRPAFRSDLAVAPAWAHPVWAEDHEPPQCAPDVGYALALAVTR